ncbi:MAG: hypothetical protein HQK91_14395 [Nitrospirae bacterium]|nr:hypothetical protein [Nitrospirota bacterium]
MQTALVGMYVKIGTDVFPSDFLEPIQVNGNQIYEFLIRDVRCAIEPETADRDAIVYNGDPAIWYLGTNEKGGYLQINNHVSEWSFGQSNWERVFEFISMLNKLAIFNKPQLNHLSSLLNEGKQAFDDMYDIPSYLNVKQSGLSWTKRTTNTKTQIQDMIANVCYTFIDRGFQIITP